jgi:hypothetical protein
MRLALNDIIAFQGVDLLVDGIIVYLLGPSPEVVRLHVARLIGGGETRFLQMPTSAASERALMLSAIDNLDVTTPPPATIYHRHESYLLKLAGSAEIEATGAASALRGPCTLWRYRAAHDQYLQIEKWPDRMRTLAGPSVHVDMLEVRPATRAP